MAKNIKIKFDADQMRRDGWSEEAINEEREWIAHLNESLNRQESEEDESEEEAVDIAVLPDNDPRVPLNVLYARREQLESLYYTYGDADVFDRICNITGIINAREEEKNHENI